MTTIACVLRSGGPVYTPEWVYALKRGLRRHLHGEYEFRVLTDLRCFGAWTIPLEHDWPGWWAKLELFRPGLFAGRVLYMDLDSIPVGDLSELAAYAGPFAMLSDFHQSKIPASGVMAWEGDELAGVHAAFLRDPAGIMRRHPSRMDHWLRTVVPTPARLQDQLPGQIVSFKRHAKAGPPAGARLVCFHGRPRVTELPGKHWARRAWGSL